MDCIQFAFVLVLNALRVDRMRKKPSSCLVFFLWITVQTIFAQPYTIHIQSPWKSNDTHSFEAGRFTENKTYLMESNGNHWHTVVITAAKIEQEYSTTTLTLKMGDSTWSETPRLRDFTALGDEVWVYIDNTGSFSVKPSGPWSVWFKSPWGNKIIPNLIYASDTIAMIPGANKSDYCGWFSYTFSEPAEFMPIYFQMPGSNLNFPNTNEAIDIGKFISNGSTVYIDAFATEDFMDTVRTSKGECFDDRYSFHLYWTGNSEVKLSAGPDISETNIHHQSGMDDWFSYNASSIGSGNSTLTLTIRDYSTNETQTYTSTQSLNEIFPDGYFDAWLRIEKGVITFTNTPIYQKYIRFLNPWSNTSPQLIIQNDTLHMKPVKNYCGWFEASFQGSIDDFEFLFKQSIGTGVYSAQGLQDGFPISLGNYFLSGDTIWIKPSPYPNGTPDFSTSFPNILGDCPIKTLAVMMFDWYDGSNPDGPYGYIAQGVPQYGTGTDEDFGKDGCEEGTSGANGATQGMVEKRLGPNGVPVRSANFPESKCKNAKHLNNWFLPETLTVKNNIAYTNATCRDITLELDKDGLWKGQKDDSSPEGGFFLLDDFKFLDSAETIPNPKFDWASGHDDKNHNFGLTMKAIAEFEYVKGQYFEFNGDDDVWVFINNKLVVDIGGQHNKVFGAVDLDTLGLTPGEIYPFHIFYAERKRYKSNFMMRTSIDLRTERTYFPTDVSTSTDIIRYEIWQVLREETLLCNFSGMEEKQKTEAPSVFNLSGGNLALGGVELKEGAHYGGILIDPGMAGFTVDTSLIRIDRSLAPGTYRLSFHLQTDPSLSGEIWFTVADYPRPSISFADSLWALLSTDTSTVGEWANTLYPIRVRILEENCNDCDGKVYLKSSNPNLKFLDFLGNNLTEAYIQDGQLLFWILATESIEDASIQIYGDFYSNTLLWKDISLKEPPVPLLDYAEMHDRNGDGIADSLYLKYTKALLDKHFPDSLSWRFGDSVFHFLNKNDLKSVIYDDSSFAITSESGFTKNVFTGLDTAAYFGFSITHFTYYPDNEEKVVFDISGQIIDRVGPIILSAIVKKQKGGVTSLNLVFSEALQKEDLQLFSDLFSYKFWRDGEKNPTAMQPISAHMPSLNRIELLFLENSDTAVPMVGDSVRFTPGVASDLSGTHPHELNPWVRIVGDQETKIGATQIISLNPNDTRITSDSTVTPYLIAKTLTKKEIIATYGSHGHIIGIDLVEVLNGLIADGDTSLTIDSLSIVYETFYFSNLGQYINSAKGSITCSDSVYNGDCRANKGDIFLAWNMKSTLDRWVGSGAYIARVSIKIKARQKVLMSNTENFIWGVQRVNNSKHLIN